MIPEFRRDGKLPLGVHPAEWQEFEQRFSQTPRRAQIMAGLLLAARLLKVAGCSTLYVNGIFVTAKSEPGDFDACWDLTDVKPNLLAPVFFDFANERVAQKAQSLLRQAERDGIVSQLETLGRELGDYEALQAGETQTFHLNSFDELPRTLIQARIARGLSQKDLAGRLGLKEQQVQRYEATEYASASLERVGAIIRALGLQVREEVTLSGQIVPPG